MADPINLHKYKIEQVLQGMPREVKRALEHIRNHRS